MIRKTRFRGARWACASVFSATPQNNPSRLIALVSAQRIVDDLPGTPYAARAKEFLAAEGAPAQLDWNCIGCHNAMAR